MYFLIGIGGTGCRSLKAFLHLSAIGLIKDELFLLAIDDDRGNGNLAELIEIVKPLSTLQKAYQFGAKDRIFSSPVYNDKVHLWSPSVHNPDKHQRFSSLLEIERLGDEWRDFNRLFYSSNQIDLSLSEGFCGKPAIGALAMAIVGESIEERPWHDFFSKMEEAMSRDSESKVFVFSSIFGGTGAAGFPIIGRLIKDIGERYGHVRLGGTIVLPYFSYDVPAEKRKDFDSKGEVYARAQDFTIKTRTALSHYHARWMQEKDNPYQAVYLSGTKDLQRVKTFSKGGGNQRNESHPVELLAALAALDFYRHADSRSDFYYACPDQSGQSDEDAGTLFRWQDLPVEREWLPSFRGAFLRFTVFAWAYLDFYLPLLRDPRFPKKSHLVPWYVDHFIRSQQSLLTQEEKECQFALESYLQGSYFPWLHQMHNVEGVHLFDWLRLEKLVNRRTGNGSSPVGDLDRLLAENTEGYSNSYDLFWQAMNTQRNPLKKGTGRLICMMMDAANQFCRKVYEQNEGWNDEIRSA